jgi:hypothetical protein
VEGEAIIPVAFYKLIKTLPQRLKHHTSMLTLLPATLLVPIIPTILMLLLVLLMREAFIQKHQVVLVASSLLDVVQDVDLDFGALIVALDGADDLDRVCVFVSLALQSPSERAVTEMTGDPVAADLLAVVVLEVTGVLVVAGVRRRLIILGLLLVVSIVILIIS